MNYSPGFRQLLFKSVLFLLFFITISGIIGPWVIGTKLLSEFYFYLYGNLGKMVLFSAVVFFLLTKDRILKIGKAEYGRKNYIFIFIAILLLPIFFTLANLLLTEQSFTTNLPLSLATHAITILIPTFLLVGTFGVDHLLRFARIFKKELLTCVGLSLVFDAAIFYVWRLWPYLSDIVLKSEYFLFSRIFDTVSIIHPRTLFVEKFAVSIEQACSGLDSLFLFSILYLIIGLIDWKKFNHKKLLFMFLVAGIGLFFINILRVFLLILAGVLISPEITTQLFHTYLGMVLFIIYFGLFWKLTYKWMQK